MRMKKLMLWILCCLILCGCGGTVEEISANQKTDNLYETDSLESYRLENTIFRVPASWRLPPYAASQSNSTSSTVTNSKPLAFKSAITRSVACTVLS